MKNFSLVKVDSMEYNASQLSDNNENNTNNWRITMEQIIVSLLDTDLYKK